MSTLRVWTLGALNPTLGLAKDALAAKGDGRIVGLFCKETGGTVPVKLITASFIHSNMVFTGQLLDKEDRTPQCMVAGWVDLMQGRGGEMNELSRDTAVVFEKMLALLN